MQKLEFIDIEHSQPMGLHLNAHRMAVKHNGEDAYIGVAHCKLQDEVVIFCADTPVEGGYSEEVLDEAKKLFKGVVKYKENEQLVIKLASLGSHAEPKDGFVAFDPEGCPFEHLLKLGFAEDWVEYWMTHEIPASVLMTVMGNAQQLEQYKNCKESNHASKLPDGHLPFG